MPVFTPKLRAGFLVTALALAGCGSPVTPLASGESLDWERLEGQWVVVNYWAEWCKPCYEEIPELNRLDGDERVQVLGVNYDGVSGQELDTLIRNMGIRFPVLLEDPAADFGWSRPLALPATFVINPAGELAEARFGSQTEEELLALINGG